MLIMASLMASYLITNLPPATPLNLVPTISQSIPLQTYFASENGARERAQKICEEMAKEKKLPALNFRISTSQTSPSEAGWSDSRSKPRITYSASCIFEVVDIKKFSETFKIQ